MGHGHRGEVHRQIQALFQTGTLGGLSDGELLDRFTTQQAEIAEHAFAVLVERHGPMVLRVCRGVLGNAHDAEDAFQATFLALASKARSIRRRDSVGSWLYGVALRVASDVRSIAARRRMHELRAAERRVERVDEPEDNNPGQVVYEEVGRLPERLRAAIVLCYMEGYTCEEAARRLGWPVGTVKTRLGSGRARLRDRLIRRGIASSVGLGTLLAAEAVRAAVPEALAKITARAALRIATGQLLSGTVSPAVETLARGVAVNMFRQQTLSAAVAVLLSLGAIICLGSLPGSEVVDAAQDAPAIVPEQPSARRVPVTPPDSQIAPLLGTWQGLTRNEKKFDPGFKILIKPSIDSREVAKIFKRSEPFACLCSDVDDPKPKPKDYSLLFVDPGQVPPHITLVHLYGEPGRIYGAPFRGRTFKGIYRMEGDTLEILFADDSVPRPTSFEIKSGLETWRDVYRRVTKDASSRR